MDLERVAAVIRPRSYPESIDLGFRMLRAWWRPVVVAWAVVGLPVFAIVALTLYRWPWVALLLFWWIKPVFARVPVYVLSRGLFGAVPGPGETIREWPRQLRGGLLASLTWRRFDPIRSLRTPVLQLEGLRGTAGRRRLSVLARDVWSDATTLALTCLLFELCIALGLLVLLLTIFPVPAMVDFFIGDGVGLARPYKWMLVGFYVLAFACIEPFHAAGGFGLYINRRTRLEGWDIEVVFRRMTSRLQSARRPLRTTVATICVVLLAGAAAGAEPAGEAAPDPGEVIQEILADPVFGTEVTESRWVVKEQEERKPAPSALAPIGAILAAGMRALAWVLAAAGLAWGIYHLVRRARASRASSKETEEPPLPTELLGMNLREDSLSDDVAGRALELWESGTRLEALRLLYRGALSGLVFRDGLPLKSSATEGDCVRISRGLLARERWEYFRLLTENWQLAAYGHREPDGELGPVLIREWKAHFGGAA